MGEKKGEDLYRNFSRKDIQSLCKKYGLPANKSNFEMATSLILYLEKKNLKSRIMWEATRSDPCPSGRSELQIRAGMISTGDQRKDCRGTASHSGSGNNGHNNQDVRQNDSQNCKAIVPFNKASENAVVLTQPHKDSNTGAGLPENAFFTFGSSSVPARSTDFQFDVRSEDGIQLCVDLNSDPSDWIESMKSGVHICQCHDGHGQMTQGFQEDLGRLSSKQMKSSSVVNSDKEMNNGNFEDGCSPTRMVIAAEAQAGEPEGGEGSLYSSRLKSCGDTVHSQGNMGEKQVTLPLRMESNRENEVSGVKICERENIKVPAVSAVNVLSKSTTCNSSGKSCDPKLSGTLENQVLTVGNDIFKRSFLQQINGFLNPALNYMEPLASGSVEIQASPFATLGHDVGPSPSRASTSMSLADELQNREGEHRGLPQSLQFHENRHQLQSVEAADGRRYGTCFNRSGSIQDELHRAEASRKFRGQVTESQTHVATCMSLSPYKRYGSLYGVHLTNYVEIENGGFIRPPEPGQEAVDVHSSMGGVEREDVLLSSRTNGVSLDIAVPEQNGSGHCTLTCSNELDAENCKSHPATCVGNVGTSYAGHGKESSECLERDLMERTCIELTNSESNGELNRKRQFNSVEDQSNYVNSGSWILRTPEHSTGDVRSSRRRSSRFSSK